MLTWEEWPLAKALRGEVVTGQDHVEGPPGGIRGDDIALLVFRVSPDPS